MKKFKMNTMKKRIISIALSLVMIASMLPLSLLNVSAADITPTSQMEKLVDVKTAPADYEANSVSNPYGLEKDQEIFLSQEDELFLYYSWDMNEKKAKDRMLYAGLADTYKKNPGSVGDGTAFNFSTDDFQSQKKLDKIGDSAAFMQAVSFAPTSSGRKTHIAVVGYNSTQKKIYSWIIEASTGDTVSDIVEICGAEWMNDINQQFEAGNFLAITAGKYDANEASESIIIYAAGQDKHARLYEMRYDVNSEDYWEVENGEIYGKMLNDHYPGGQRDDYRHDSDDDNKKRNKLAADLATGDFNGDGADDLAVVSYMLCAENPEKYQAYAYMPYLTVQYGVPVGEGNVGGYDKILNDTPDSEKYICDIKVNNNKDIHDGKGRKEFNGMYEAGIAAGDVDGDGYDEIIVAGIKASVHTEAANSNWSDDYGMHESKIYEDKFKIAVIDAVDSIKRTIFTDADTNEWTEDGFYNKDDVASQFQIECVATNGQNAAEQIFISGTLFEVKGSSVSAVHTPWYFQSGDQGADGSTITNTYIESIVAGNFDGNDLGREQLAFTIALKVASLDEYYYLAGIFGGKDYKLANGNAENPNKGQYGTAQGYYMSDPEESQFVENKGSRPEQRVNCFVVDVDTDSDGTLAKYKGHSYIYSDPQVLAVLQAAPYFGELGNASGETSYGITQTYTTGKSAGSQTSWAIGIMAEVTAGPVKVGVENQYLGSINKEFETGITTSYAIKFVATNKDTVVVYRTPFIVYSYSLSTNGEDWTDNALSIQVPLSPSYEQMSVSDYNTFVDYYNATLHKDYSGGKDVDSSYDLKKLNDIFLGNEGNPWGYMSEVNGASGFVNLSKAQYSLGYSNGRIISEYSKSTSETVKETTTNGFHFGLSVAMGTDVPGAGAWAGISANVDAVESNSKYTTTTNGSQAIGTVSDIDVVDLSTKSGIPESHYRAFGFNWEYGAWVHDLGAGGKNVPVYGYKLYNVTAPDPVIASLSANLIASTTAKLSWEKPNDDPISGRKKITGYNVYRVQEVGSPILLEENIDANATDCIIAGLDPASIITFVVKCVYEDGTESLPSNTAWVGTGGANLSSTVEALDKAVKELEQAIADGDADLAAKLEALEKAYKAADDLINSNIEGLETVLEKAEATLQAAIDKVQENLNQAVEALEIAIANGDADLSSKIQALDEAYKAADVIINNGIEGLKNADADILASIVALKASLTKADADLTALVNAVQTNLDKSVNDLNISIANGDKSISEKVTALEKAYNAADAVINSNIVSLKAKDETLSASITTLEGSLLQAKTELQVAIEQVQKNLDSSVDELNQIISDKEKELSDKISAIEQKYIEANADLSDELATTRVVAIIALILAVLSLLWNATTLVISLTKKKRVGIK